jgi:hypothetical protein
MPGGLRPSPQQEAIVARAARGPLRVAAWRVMLALPAHARYS